MLATAEKAIPEKGSWIYEPKYDGVRCLTSYDGKDVQLFSRNQKRLETTFPELVPELKKLSPKPFIADGEIVAGGGKMNSFALLQQRMGVTHPSPELVAEVAVTYYLFDLISFDGEDLRKVPLLERKVRLARLHFGKRVRKTPHRKGSGPLFFAQVAQRGYEGVVAKQANSFYSSQRSRQWIKVKCQQRQELVICGFTTSARLSGVAALLLGYYAGGELQYAGKVGTGFSQENRKRLAHSLRRQERQRSPLHYPPVGEKRVHWVAPKYVAEIAFTEWTRYGRLRQGSFVGLRTDKKASQVKREGQ
jgi:bifunctional non-homologous end joining protein LigD